MADSFIGAGVLGVDGRASTGFEPVYPFFLAAARLLFGDRIVLIQLLQVCVAAAGAVLLYHLTLHLTASRRAATCAGAVFALHPLLIRQASSASDLPIATTLLVAFALVFVRIHSVGDAALAGLVIGITVLTRSMAMPVVACAAALLLMRRQRQHAAALALACALMVAPMVVRTYLVSGSLALTRSGVALYVGNSPHSAALLPTYDLDLLEPEAYEVFARARPDVDPVDPRFAAEFDAYLTRQSFAFMAEHPLATFRQKILNVAYLLSPRITPYEISGPATRVRTDGDAVLGVDGAVPRQRSEIAAYAAISLVLLVGGAAGVYLRRRDLRHDAILWAIFGTFAFVNALYIPATRYTAPTQFVLIFYAAAAVGRLGEGSGVAAARAWPRPR